MCDISDNMVKFANNNNKKTGQSMFPLQLTLQITLQLTLIGQFSTAKFPKNSPTNPHFFQQTLTTNPHWLFYVYKSFWFNRSGKSLFSNQQTLIFVKFLEKPHFSSCPRFLGQRKKILIVKRIGRSYITKFWDWLPYGAIKVNSDDKLRVNV